MNNKLNIRSATSAKCHPENRYRPQVDYICLSFIYYLSLPSVLAKEVSYVNLQSCSLIMASVCSTTPLSATPIHKILQTSSVNVCRKTRYVPVKKHILLQPDLFFINTQLICINKKHYCVLCYLFYIFKYKHPQITQIKILSLMLCSRNFDPEIIFSFSYFLSSLWTKTY